MPQIGTRRRTSPTSTGKKFCQKVAKLESTRWNYKQDKEKTPHLGPVVQDFYAAFGLGSDNRHITQV